MLPQPSGDQHAAVSQSAIAHRHIKPFFHEIHDAVADLVRDSLPAMSRGLLSAELEQMVVAYAAILAPVGVKVDAATATAIALQAQRRRFSGDWSEVAATTTARAMPAGPST